MTKLDDRQKAIIRYRFDAVLHTKVNEQIANMMLDDIVAGDSLHISVDYNLKIDKNLKVGTLIGFDNEVEGNG